jgi:UDP-N-acetylglucosamine--N-acetylmuramyl-(pentapeptide) pyrophosphoryl-undecaprenol N-acetylglucosamine transferase
MMITGGGTAGHTSPVVAVVEELQKRDPQFHVQWVGRKGSVEERVCKALVLPFRPVPVEGWPRKRSLRKIWVAAKLALGVAKAYFYIKRFKPQVVVGSGGYVCLPLMIAAQRIGLPTVILEQNKRLGMANRMLAPRATRLLFSFDDTEGAYPAEKVEVVGNPVRAAFESSLDKSEAIAAFGLDPSMPVVLVTGGSQGAQSINNAVGEALALFQENEVQVIWLAGEANIAKARVAAEKCSAQATVFSFIDNMAQACAAADIIVSRGGASSTAEIAAIGLPSILIPYPHATDDHQTKNARAFAEAGAAILLSDDDCTGDRLAREIRSLLSDKMKLDEMASAAKGLAYTGAAQAIAEILLGLVFEE